MNINSKRRKQRITALTLAATLFLSGCGEDKNSSFELVENENNEIVAMEDSYIDNKYISEYYVLEVYNKIKNENEIYIVSKKVVASRGYHYYGYLDIFTNVEIVNNKEKAEDMFDLVKVTSLKDYIISFGLEQLKYSYDDMKNIYESIKENYVFESDDSLRKKLTNNNRI